MAQYWLELKMIKLLKLWILGSTACVAAGWILSTLHELNLTGYAVFFVLFAAGWAFEYMRGRQKQAMRPMRLHLRRFRRPLPLLFLLTAVLAFCGGALHAPNNYDALTYRFPRVLHWWAASGWHWIVTPNDRMNLSGTNFEWLMMPLFVLTHGDRLFFLINFIAFLFLPGLVFLVFNAAGVARRVAWFWMWLLPAALCYAMQAGSISNDTVAATYFLAAIYFALEARRSRNIRNLWLAFLAAGLFTGIKASNLPLGLPIVWAFWPAMRLVERRFAASLAVVFLSALVSFVPTALLNRHFTGDWAGDPNNLEKLKVDKPLAGILGNSLQLALQSLEPPFLPLAHAAEVWVWERFPANLQAVLKKDFPRFAVQFRELPQEESAGLGIGITAVGIVSIVAALRFRTRDRHWSTAWVRRKGLVIGVLTWAALLVYMSKLGSESTSRLIAAYYPLLLLPLALTTTQRFLVRQRWYLAMAICASLVAVLAVILTPSRPLWPAETFLEWASSLLPGKVVLKRAKTVFEVYRCRNDLFAPLRKSIPESVSVIGVIEAGDDVEASLWRPYGARRVVHVMAGDRAAESRLQWLVVKNNFFGTEVPEAFEGWLRRSGGVLVDQQFVTEKAGVGPEKWSVVRFPASSN